jgi:hypothetical protein
MLLVREFDGQVHTDTPSQSDNDFLSTQGVSLGQPFNAGEDVDNQFLVFRVTLPGASPSVNKAIGL